MPRFILTYWLVVAAGWMLQCPAQTFRTLSARDGLSDLVVNAIYKDSTGYVWFGTSNSIERFDGAYFKQYAIPNEEGKGKEVFAITGLPDRCLCFGNKTGLWRIGTDDEVKRIAADQIKTQVNTIIYRNHCLYVGTETGLFILDGEKTERILPESDALSVSNRVRGLALYEEKLWIATTEGLYAMSLPDRTMERYRPKDPTIPLSYNNLYISERQVLLGTSGEGIIAFDMDTKQFSRYLNLGSIMSLSGNPEKRLLYVATNGRGIYFVSTEDKRIVKTFEHNPDMPEGLRSNSIYSLLVDREGIIWAGVFQMGVDYSLYQHKLFTLYQPSKEINFSHSSIRAIEMNGATKVIGTRDKLFFINEKEHIYRTINLPMVFAICLHEGQYYIGSYEKGLYLLDPHTGKLSDFDWQCEGKFDRVSVFSVTPDHQGDLWIGTSMGLFCYRNGKLQRRYTDSNSKLPSGNVYHVFFDSTGRGWICMDRNLFLLDTSPERILTDRFPDGFINKELIRNIYEDSSHNLWFCPDKGGLFVSNLSLTRFNSIAGTPFSTQKSMFAIEDDDHYLWVGTNDGLYRYDKKEHCDSYDFVDGVPSTLFLNCNAKKEANGTLWFGSSQGIFYTDPSRIKAGRSYPYSLAFTDVDFEGKRIPLTLSGTKYEVHLPSSYGKTAIRVSDFLYSDPRYAQYEYLSESKDRKWHSLNSSELSFHNLGSGLLRLRRPGRPESEICLQVNAPASPFGYWAAGIIVTALAAASFIFWRKKRAAQKAAEAALAEAESEEEDKYKHLNMTEKECKQVVAILNSLMENEKLYLDPKLRMADICRHSEILSHKLSYVFNQYLKQTFWEYLAVFRVNKFKELVNKGEYENYTINTLFGRSGFQSRTHFYTSFKNLTGMTPNEYIETVKKEKLKKSLRKR